jgi:hypothetical protein
MKDDAATDDIPGSAKVASRMDLIAEIRHWKERALKAEAVIVDARAAIDREADRLDKEAAAHASDLSTGMRLGRIRGLGFAITMIEGVAAP